MSDSKELFKQFWAVGDESVWGDETKRMWKVWQAAWNARQPEVVAPATEVPIPTGWIPVTKRLPHQSETVLVWESFCGEILVGWIYNRGVWDVAGGDTDNEIIITHWQPLPEPPKGRGGV
jgi:hypothetical protein